MADDIKIKLGLDAAELFNGLNKVTTELNQVQNESKQTDQALDKMADINTSGAVADVNKLSEAIDGVGDSAGGLGGVFEGLKGGLSDAFSGGLIGSLVGGGLAGGIQAGIGAIVDGFGAVMDAGRGLISAQGDLQAQTGATGAEFEALKNAADEAFLGGVGESVAEATKIISNAKVVLKDALPTDQIGEFVKGAQALGNLYEKDVNEVIAKSTPFIKQFGLDGKEAFDLIAFAAKEGKTSQDDVLDTLAEYSQLLSEAGFSAEEFAGQMAIAGQEGLFNTDKIADSIKEAQIRLKAGDTAKAFTDIKNQLPQALGSTLGNLEQLASSGQITIKDFLSKSGEAIKTAFDSGQISEAMASQLQVAVAGTPAEDIGVEAYNKMFGAPIPVEEIKKKAAQAGQDAMNAAGQYLSFDMVGRNLELAFEKSSAMVVSGLSTAFGMIATAVGPTFEKLSSTISEYFTRIWSVVQPILALIGGSIIANITYALNMAMTILDIFYNVGISIFDGIWKAIEPVVSAFQNLGNIIAEALGFGGKAGESINFMETFQNILNTMTSVVSYLGDIISDVLGGAISFLFTPMQLLGQAIGTVIGYIVTWIKESGVLQAVIGTVTGVISFFKGVITDIQNTFNSVIAVVIDFGEYLDVVFNAVNSGGGIFKGFGDIIDSVGSIIGTVADTIYNFGVETINTYFIEPIKTAIGWVQGIINKVKDWILSLPGVQTALGFIQSIIQGVQQFFNNTDNIIRGVKLNIAGMVFAIGEVSNIAKNIFDNIVSLNFGAAIDTIAQAPKRLADAFAKGKEGADQFLKAQESNVNVVKKLNTETQNLNNTQKTGLENLKLTELEDEKGGKGGKDGKDGKGGGGKSPEAKSALERLKEDLKDEEDAIKSSNFFKLEEAIKAGEDEKVARARLDAEGQAKLREFLNTRLADVKDANAILNQEQITSIIKPSAKKGETVQDVISFYTDTIQKFNKSKGAEVKVNIGAANDKEIQDQLKGLVKRIQDQSKTLEGSLDKLIPASAVKTTEELKKVQDSYDSYAQYVQGQALDIQAAIDVAIGLGDDKTQRLLEQQLEANQTALNDAKTKLDKFAKDSAAEIEKNSGLSGAILTLQTALNDAFNIEKIRKERETNEQIRQERINALNAEEDDLMGSLAKREISFEEYSSKVADIEKARQDAMEQTETTFLERMKGVMDQTVGNLLKGQSSAISGFVQDQFKDTEGKVSDSGKIIGNLMGNLATQFGDLALSGKATLMDFARSSVLVAYEALQQMIPIFIAEIAGKQFAELGLLGLASAAALTIALNGLFAAAAPSLGFKDGVVGLEGPGTERSDSIPAWLSKGESVITAAGTRANREELEWMNKNPGMSIRDYFTANTPAVRYSVNNDGDLIQEVRKLREETRGLGKQINRNTHVEISGALVADNNSIKAVIERDRRRNARRG